MGCPFIARRRKSGRLHGARRNVSRSGFHASLDRTLNARSRRDGILVTAIYSILKSRDRTCGACSGWNDVLAKGLPYRLHRVDG